MLLCQWVLSSSCRARRRSLLLWAAALCVLLVSKKSLEAWGACAVSRVQQEGCSDKARGCEMRLWWRSSRCGQLSRPQQGCSSGRESLHVGRAGVEDFTVVSGPIAVHAARQRCSQLLSQRWSGGCSLLGCLHACYFTDWISWTVTLIGFHAAINELSCAKASVHIPDSSCSAWWVATLYESESEVTLTGFIRQGGCLCHLPHLYIWKTVMWCVLCCHLQSGLQSSSLMRALFYFNALHVGLVFENAAMGHFQFAGGVDVCKFIF